MFESTNNEYLEFLDNLKTFLRLKEMHLKIILLVPACIGFCPTFECIYFSQRTDEEHPVTKGMILI